MKSYWPVSIVDREVSQNNLERTEKSHKGVVRVNTTAPNE